MDKTKTPTGFKDSKGKSLYRHALVLWKDKDGDVLEGLIRQDDKGSWFIDFPDQYTYFMGYSFNMTNVNAKTLTKISFSRSCMQKGCYDYLIKKDKENNNGKIPCSN